MRLWAVTSVAAGLLLSAGATVAEAASAGNNDSGGNSSGIGKPGDSSAKSPANTPSNFKAAGGTGNSADAKSGGAQPASGAVSGRIGERPTGPPSEVLPSVVWTPPNSSRCSPGGVWQC